MGGGRITTMIPNLFSTDQPREQAALTPTPTIPLENSTASSRHILPSDLPAAIRHLNDQDLDQLEAAVTAEQQRRGKKPLPSKPGSKRMTEMPAVTLSIGKQNAVRAAFKAGVTPAKIAKQFGIPQSDVRRVIANETMKL